MMPKLNEMLMNKKYAKLHTQDLIAKEGDQRQCSFVVKIFIKQNKEYRPFV